MKELRAYDTGLDCIIYLEAAGVAGRVVGHQDVRHLDQVLLHVEQHGH